MLKFALGLIALLGTASAGLAQEMTVTTPDALKWGPAPPVLPKGAQLAVLSGDPGANGPYVVRLPWVKLGHRTRIMSGLPP